MIKVGIELPDASFSGIDLSRPQDGNPGVGGSEYLFALLGRYLAYANKDGEYRIVFYHYNDNFLPSGTESVKVGNQEELVKRADQDEMDILIHQVSKPAEWYHILSGTRLKAIAWAHVYLTYEEVKAINMCENVKRIVFVGKEEYDAYIDDDIILRSVYIYNMINTLKEYEVRKQHYDNNITYVGALVPAKGFHVLAKIWNIVLKEVPDAKLNVVGMGKLYDRQAKMGIYGIAQENYENEFMKYLCDDSGNLLPSVNFLGLLGAEKEQIFANTAVGIVNPTALTETFCVSAIEMGLCGVPVVSKRKWGLLDTVKHNKTGLLFKKESQFANQIIFLLKHRNINNMYGSQAIQFVKDTFDANKIIKHWLQLLNDVYMDKKAEFAGVYGNYTNDFKWAKIIIRFLRFTLHIKIIPSFVKQKYLLKQLLK